MRPGQGKNALDSRIAREKCDQGPTNAAAGANNRDSGLRWEGAERGHRLSLKFRESVISRSLHIKVLSQAITLSIVKYRRVSFLYANVTEGFCLL